MSQGVWFVVATIVLSILFLVSLIVVPVIQTIIEMKREKRTAKEIGKYCAKKTWYGGDSRKSFICGIIAIVVSFGVFGANIMMDSYKSLDGQISIISRIEEVEGVITPHGDRIDCIATIQNSGNNLVSIKGVYLVLGDGQRIELSKTNDLENDKDDNYFENVVAYGRPINKGEAVQLKLSIEGFDKDKLIDKSLAKCIVEDTSGQTYPLVIRPPYVTFTDSVVNQFTFAESPKQKV